jgi:ABC-2 type transport system ATP-binding protein
MHSSNPSTDSPAIQVAEVSKRYQAFDIDRKDSGLGLWFKNSLKLTGNRASATQALNAVSFQVEQGELFGIFGANGAGKTTLIKILSGLLRAEQGSVCVQGQNDVNRIKSLVSYVSTNGWMGLEWQLTAYENLLLYGNLFAVSGRVLRRRCDTILEQLGLAEVQHKFISELSAGMRQKITLARGLILDRPILYLDEPSVSLDVQSATLVRRMAVNLAAEEGKTILITSHNPVDLAICNRIMLLHQGRVLRVDTLDNLLAPLQEVATLHIAFISQSESGPNEASQAALAQLPSVRSITIEPPCGQRKRWLARLTINQTDQPINEIVDWFIAQNLPIMNLKLAPITLQEIYEYFLAQANPVPA